MNFAEFKDALEGATLGDKIVPENKQLLSLANLALTRVASEAKPIYLTTNDIEYDPLVFLEDEYFIRKPNKVIDDDSLIDIDDDLVMAVVYTTAVFFVKDKGFAKAMADDIINIYRWNKYSAVCELDDCEGDEYG